MSGRRAPATLTLLLVSFGALADTGATLKVEAVESGHWRLSGLAASVELDDGGLRAEVRIDALELTAEALEFPDIRIECQKLRLTTQHFRCDDGRLTAPFPGIGRHAVPARFNYARQTGVTRFDLPALPVAGTGVRVQGENTPTGTRIEFDASSLDLEALLALANALGAGLDEVSASGRTSATGRLSVGTDGKLSVTVHCTLEAVSLSNETGTAVAESVHGDARLSVAETANGWQSDIEVAAHDGEIYVEPFYANVSEHTLGVRAHGVETADFTSFRMPQLHVEQASLLSIDGELDIALPDEPDEAARLDGRIEFADSSVEAVYGGLLQVLAAGTVLGDLETAGRFDGRITIADNVPQSADLVLRDVIIDDRQRRFAVYGLGGTVHWPGPGAEAADAETSQLHWDSGAAYSIELGGGEVAVRLGGDDVELLRPLRLPAMGGALLVNRLAMHNYGRDDASGLLDAELEPVQLGQLTGAFGWPAFSGSLSGRLPLLQYEGNAMTVGGRLTARAFDGDIEVANLRLEQPFGRVPRLHGDLRLRQLDLERITDTFSFGLIQGRLSGDVTALEMLDWQPVAMDLHVYTPPGDDSRHRISQRAVENLASVGGGGGAAVALSSGFLKFFEVFAYDRIGLRCVLKDGACAMSGTGDAGEGPAGRGYYIVKGSGLPRIEVIGYRRSVSWPSLMEQLAAITRSGGPVVN